MYLNIYIYATVEIHIRNDKYKWCVYFNIYIFVYIFIYFRSININGAYNLIQRIIEHFLLPLRNKMKKKLFEVKYSFEKIFTTFFFSKKNQIREKKSRFYIQSLL